MTGKTEKAAPLAAKHRSTVQYILYQLYFNKSLRWRPPAAHRRTDDRLHKLGVLNEPLDDGRDLPRLVQPKSFEMSTEQASQNGVADPARENGVQGWFQHGPLDVGCTRIEDTQNAANAFNL